MDEKITIMQAYKAMYLFLRSYYYRIGKPDELATLLGGMTLMKDGGPVDPACWPDWLEAVEESRKEDKPQT